MIYICNTCGANYAEAEIQGLSGRCVMSAEGGAICKGRLLPSGGTLPHPLTALDGPEATDVIPARLAEMMKNCVMQRSGVYATGEARALLTFSTVDDRNEFANWIVFAGGKIQA